MQRYAGELRAARTAAHGPDPVAPRRSRRDARRPATTSSARSRPRASARPQRMAEWLNRRLAHSHAHPGQPGACAASRRPRRSARKFTTVDGARARRAAPRHCSTPRAGPTRASRCWSSATSRRSAWRRPSAAVGVAAAVGDQEGRRLVAAPPASATTSARSSCRRCSRPTACSARAPASRSSDGASAGCSSAAAAPRPRLPRAAGAGCADASRPSRRRAPASAGRPSPTQRDLGRIDVAARMADDDRQPQAQQLPGEASSLPAAPRSCAGRRAGRAPGRRCAAAGSARSPARRRARAGRRCGGGGRGARPSCRSRAARRPSAARAAPRRRRLGATLVVAAPAATAATRCGLRGVDLEAPLQLAHRGVAHVVRRPRRDARSPQRARPGRRSRPGAARRAPAAARRCRSASPACRGSPGRRRCTARRSSFRPGSCEPVDAAGLEALLACSQRRPSGVMRPSVTPLAASTCDTAPTVPDEPSASRQWRGANGSSASSSSAPAAICAARNAALGEAAVGEVLHRQADAADLERLGAAAAARRGRGSSRSSARRCRSTSRGASDGCSRATPA